MKSNPGGWIRRSAGSREAVPEVETSLAPEAEPVPLTTFFDDDCKIDGKLVMKTSIQINGEFGGAIHCDETVTVGPDAAVQGSILARCVFVMGAVLGNIDASREVVLHGTGRITGDVKTPSFVIERGAFFNGRTRMYRPELVARDGAASLLAVATPSLEKGPAASLERP